MQQTFECELKSFLALQQELGVQFAPDEKTAFANSHIMPIQ